MAEQSYVVAIDKRSVRQRKATVVALKLGQCGRARLVATETTVL